MSRFFKQLQHIRLLFQNLVQRRYFNYNARWKWYAGSVDCHTAFMTKWRKGSAVTAYTVALCIVVGDFGQFAFDVYRVESRCWRMRSTLCHALVVVACTLAVPRQILAGQQAMLLNLAIVRSNGTMHTSAKARLTSVRIRIRIRIHIRSGSPTKFRRLFIDPLSTFRENFVQIRSEVFVQSCSGRQRNFAVCERAAIIIPFDIGRSNCLV